MTPSPACTALVRQFEGCAKKRPDGRYDAYPDPGSGGDPWTIGWGSTGADVKPGVVWTQQQCDARLAADLARFGDQVTRMMVGAPTTQGEFDALTSFAYNLGAGNLRTSTLLKLHRAGDKAGAALEFAKWNHAGGRVLSGLTLRRAAEAAMYRGQA